MSRYSYAGKFVNPTEGWTIREVGDHFEIWVQLDRSGDGSAEPDRKHTSAPDFETEEDAEEWITGTSEAAEEDYDDYLDENRFEIARMERYEQFRREF